MNLNRYAIELDTQMAYSIKQIAKLTTICRSKIFEAIKNGELKAFKVGSRTISTPEEVKKWIEGMPSVIK
jgi:excisionase family DNA binding protein